MLRAMDPTAGNDAGNQPKLRVLVVDDDRLSRRTTARLLGDAGYHAESVENAYRALDALVAEPWDVILCDLRMPGMDGLELMEAVKREHPDVGFIVMTAYATVETAVSALKGGAADYITKPFRFQELDHRLHRIAELRGYQHEIQRLRRLLDDSGERSGIMGRSPAIMRVLELVATYADHAAPVLVTGETGTGKELVARALHDRGSRAGQPFVPVACGAIPGELAESELFGHERGAFTGATSQRIGAFERANHGSLLLDDIDDLPPLIQSKLLRVLQEGEVRRIGGNRTLEVDVRVIATTKVDLAAAVEATGFRSDLYYRLRGLEIRLAPLRERPEDILVLSQHFLGIFARSAGTAEPELSPEAAEALRRHRWPGNVRELRRAIESAAVACQGGPTIQLSHMPEAILREDDERANDLFSVNLAGCERIPFAETVHAFEQELLQWALRQAGGQQSRAAELLGLPRTTFQSKLRRDD